MKQETEQQSYLPEFVYGGIDGSVTTFAVVMGAVGASLSAGVILILGFANLFADGFSMAVSNYLSTKSQRDLHHTHRDFKQFQRFSKEPLKTGIATFISFVSIGFIPLVSFVLALFIPALEGWKYWLSVVLTGLAFIIVGAIKGYVVGKHWVRSALETFLIGSIAAGLAFLIGYWLQGIVG